MHKSHLDDLCKQPGACSRSRFAEENLVNLLPEADASYLKP